MSIALLLIVPVFQSPEQAQVRYPTFEPFVASRMFRMFGDPKAADLAELTSQLQAVSKATAEAKEVGEMFAPPRSTTLSASLQPEVELAQRSIAPLVPLVLMKLEPLWSATKWTSDQVAAARAGAAILARLPGAPAPAFAEDKDAENHAGLEAIVRWFGKQVARPEWLAAMIFTMDDGPFAGLPYESAQVLPAIATKALDEKTSVALCRVERAKEPWVLQAVREGKPLWSRVISGAPDESVAEATFHDEPAERLGPYGWKIQMTVTWSQGTELAEVFLDAKGQLLFYFLSW